MANTLFGWDLLYGSIENDVRNNQDILVSLTHLILVSNGFKCIGLGESKTLDGSETKSEALPKYWNEHYAMRYVYQGRLYNFKATILDDGVMINLIRVDERTVSLVQLNSRSVAQRSGTLDEMIPDNKSIVDLIKRQLIDKVIVSKKSRETSSQTEAERASHESSRSIRDPRSLVPPGIPRVADPLSPSVFIPGNYGRSDLDPFGVDPLRDLRVPNSIIIPGGGNLFQPPGPSFGGPPLPPGVPPGSIPPGARFDPFRPPDIDRFTPRHPRPDNDELPPPGYDDMFM
ncbi:unnamed protein product [Phaedon cochleariae]|uniref:Proteasome inhibitor PI31 subunit n=1 Tax=Phaedon cochleariae TaxID=80249 RepID=A0A9P0DSD7_PHACE|nr:unnamed protein product [Phaedon cochleariae]